MTLADRAGRVRADEEEGRSVSVTGYPRPSKLCERVRKRLYLIFCTAFQQEERERERDRTDEMAHVPSYQSAAAAQLAALRQFLALSAASSSLFTRKVQQKGKGMEGNTALVSNRSQKRAVAL